jgi:hypothetical protein
MLWLRSLLRNRLTRLRRLLRPLKLRLLQKRLLQQKRQQLRLRCSTQWMLLLKQLSNSIIAKRKKQDVTFARHPVLVKLIT